MSHDIDHVSDWMFRLAMHQTHELIWDIRVFEYSLVHIISSLDVMAQDESPHFLLENGVIDHPGLSFSCTHMNNPPRIFCYFFSLEFLLIGEFSF
jgi:hypothetical protein